MNSEFSNRGITLARRVRRRLSRLFGLPTPEHIILTPSLLAAIQLLFLGLTETHRIALGSSEYYSPEHFPGVDVKVFDPYHIVDMAADFRPQILILSLVSWKGNLIPVSKLFRETRLALGEHSPLLIADCTHAGAAGFPRIDELNADIVCGDACKWIMPQTEQHNLAFMWFPRAEFHSRISIHFRPFYLAVEGPQLGRASRWVKPETLEALDKYLVSFNCSRKALRRQHQNNMKLAARINDGIPETSIVMVTNPQKLRTLPRFINELGLSWELEDGVRILCRAQ